MFQKTPLPAWSAHWFGLALPWVETILGFLVLAGAAYALRFDRRIGPHIRSYVRLNYAPGLGKRGLQLIYASIYAALLAFRDKNVYSLDALLRGDDDEKQR